MNYYKRKEISNSDLDYLKNSYADYLAYRENGQDDTKAMNFGRIFHSYILEDKKEFVLDDEICEEIGGARPRSTEAYKRWVAEQVKGILKTEDFELLNNMRTAVYNHHISSEILTTLCRSPSIIRTSSTAFSPLLLLLLFFCLEPLSFFSGFL